MTDAMRLERALDGVHAALLAANFDELPKILAETDRLLANFQGLPDQATAARLRQKAGRNSQCLLAAARGLRSAQRRMVEMAETSASLSTYTSRGQRFEVGFGPGAMTRRL